MLAAIALSAVLQQDPSVRLHQPDTSPLEDPMRPVTEITRNSFTLQFYTSQPCATRVEYRQDDLPMTAFGRTSAVKWLTSESTGPAATWHRIQVKGLEPGKRYYYRVYDPGLKPTSEERLWGASDGYYREYAVSTEAAKGFKTIIHLPVKVLLMPNVINVISAYGERANPAPEPPALTPEQIQKVKDEYAVSSRFFWVNSGMRLWVDYQFFIDDRWQRWGEAPNTATGLYKGLPLCRDYPGRDYADPGGGDFTILDTHDISKANKEPVVEPQPYSGQIEVAFVRRWDANRRQWEFYNSGGGTLGVEEWPHGIPGRSQYLGGGDLAWLTTHEFHHDLESHGAYSLSNREDERIVFNHYAPRRRIVSGANVDEMDWTSSGRHGEHWDGMAYWDRMLSDAQWLRFYFGTTEVVKDRDGDGIPDDDKRLPLDEKRFGSNPGKLATDGEMDDLDKAMLSTWAPMPLQSTWIKGAFQGWIPDPKKRVEPGPYPLYPFEPIIVPMHATVDGDDAEWSGVPLAGHVTGGGVDMTFKQSHDEAGYYGAFELKGPWTHVDAIFDGEGKGVYSGDGVQSFKIVNLDTNDGVQAGPDVGVVDVQITPFKAPGLKWRAKRRNGTTIFEFSFPNRGRGIWYWQGGGHEIGTEINVWDDAGRGYAMGEAYHPFYARMIEAHGQTPMPSSAPAELGLEGSTVMKPGDKRLHETGPWTLQGNALVYTGGDDEGAVYVDVPKSGDFDLAAVLEASNDGIVGAFSAGQKLSAGDGYIGFVGGYSNTSTRMRLNGQEIGNESIGMTPGRHTIQLIRREDEVWLLLDGRAILWSPDPTPQLQITRFAVIGGYGGNQKLYELRFRSY